MRSIPEGGKKNEMTAPSSPERIAPEQLGSDEFRRDYRCKYNYYAGAMYKGIASKEMVIALGKAGFLSFLGTGGMTLDEIESNIKIIQQELGDAPYGMNLLSNPIDPSAEMASVELYLKYNVPVVEAAAYIEISPALALYRIKGLMKEGDRVIANNKVIGKVSRPEIAEVFLSPVSQKIIDQLLGEGRITKEEAELTGTIPVADDLCVEADSGGHTDQGSAYALLPAMQVLCDASMKKYNYAKRIRVGTAGGIGTPQAACAAFILGADFVVTGSINQCTVEAGTSDLVKEMLSQINVQDTAYAPAGDLFEMGAKVQVLRKGVFFPARANKLYDLYNRYNSLDELDEKTKKQLEEKYFKRTFTEIYEDCKAYYPQGEIDRVEKNPKAKMAMVF
ncbi:MAG: PfaD family polyunsaturated fatty acid/polyketide biosynthesis protein, partial [bacterium]|nr:PfaD family polyunsaturated fatty acid/polyketide biosynthesis protein [bacterium]